ncbi:hypothetical protein [Paracidovorax avenae]|uniref:hypothetical protein n=1 Tax=Paracidovorax avenae TaxID=80867 RepID=UPI001AD83979|nr:hypothetical protein [Paracidovorax avenae]
MLNFVRKLDRLAEKMIDSEVLLPGKGRISPISIKTIFENLRYYTVLAFLFAGMQLLLKDGARLTTVAALVLGLAMAPLALLVYMQTSYIVLASSFGCVVALMSPRTGIRLRDRLRASDRTLKVVVFSLVVPIMGACVLLGTAIVTALARAGLL